MICFEPRKFLTAKEVAACLGGKCTQATVNALIRAGKLKGKKVARGWRILPEWLDEFMTQPDNVKEKT
jgi:excisionase family DNA binding protein